MIESRKEKVTVRAPETGMVDPGIQENDQVELLGSLDQETPEEKRERMLRARKVSAGKREASAGVFASWLSKEGPRCAESAEFKSIIRGELAKIVNMLSDAKIGGIALVDITKGYRTPVSRNLSSESKVPMLNTVVISLRVPAVYDHDTAYGKNPKSLRLQRTGLAWALIQEMRALETKNPSVFDKVFENEKAAIQRIQIVIIGRLPNARENSRYVLEYPSRT